MNPESVFWSNTLPEPFNARYGGQCPFIDCEKRNVIEIGDVVQYFEDELMHLRCARRSERGETAPLCEKCWCYHRNDCA